MNLFKSLRILFYLSTFLDLVIILLLCKHFAFSLNLEIFIILFKIIIMIPTYIATFINFNKQIIAYAILDNLLNVFLVFFTAVIFFIKLTILIDFSELLFIELMIGINFFSKIFIIQKLCVLNKFLVFDILIPSLDCYLEQQSLIGGPQEVFRGEREIFDFLQEDFICLLGSKNKK